MSLIFTLGEADTLHEYLVHPDYLPKYGDALHWCHNMDPGSAAMLLVLGAVFLLFGYTIYRALIALTAAILGAYLGFGLCQRMANMSLIGLSVGAVVFGAVAWVWTNWIAAVIGAIIGGLLGSAIWQMAGLSPAFAWSGALTGAVFLGMLCFVLFRISVIIYTSLQGAVMLSFGILGMAYKYETAGSFVDQRLSAWPMSLPALILVLMLCGIGYQYAKAPAGKSGGGGGSRKASNSEARASAKDD
jgi:hypothetical protein